MEPRRRTLRHLGGVIALSTPITAFISFATFSIIFGEDNFEGANGTTTLGLLVMALPLIAGLTTVAWAQFGGPVPSRAQVAVAAIIFGLSGVALGLFSVIDAKSDASIGGGLLVMFGCALAVAGVVLRRTGSSMAQPPPPSAPGQS